MEYNEEEVYGELALLNIHQEQPQSRQLSNCELWSLYRLTFNQIVKEAAIKKREKYEEFLKRVAIL